MSETLFVAADDVQRSRLRGNKEFNFWSGGWSDLDQERRISDISSCKILSL